MISAALQQLECILFSNNIHNLKNVHCCSRVTFFALLSHSLFVMQGKENLYIVLSNFLRVLYTKNYLNWIVQTRIIQHNGKGAFLDTVYNIRGSLHK